jgi:hypothetical protein
MTKTCFTAEIEEVINDVISQAYAEDRKPLVPDILKALDDAGFIVAPSFGKLGMAGAEETATILRYHAREAQVFDHSNDTVVVTRELLFRGAAGIDRLSEALKPFAAAAEFFDDWSGRDDANSYRLSFKHAFDDDEPEPERQCTIGDLLRARAAQRSEAHEQSGPTETTIPDAERQ